jgi:serine/threonine-protein kinase
MTKESRIQQLLEEALDSSRTPQEVCRDHPELLPAVLERWNRLQAVDAQIEALFPASNQAQGSSSSNPSLAFDTRLPEIPGYEVECVLGRGGVGVVYKARHVVLNRPVALKMLLAGAYAGPQELTRFRREAEAVAALRHANIVQVYDVGELDGRPYFTMEFVEGGDLALHLAAFPQPAPRAAEMVATLANAVQTAHDGGIVHRDLKPANILLTSDGTLKITDFGLARRLECDPSLTISGARVGTPSYMAPEQAAGNVEAFCPSVDIYSLGALLYEMLTGRPPFRAESTSETQRQVIQEEPAPPSRLNAKVPRDLETICLKCLQKVPQRRYAAAAELSADLQRFLRGQPITARPVGRLERSIRWVRRNPTASALIVTALALFALAVDTGLRQWNFAHQQRAEMQKWTARLEFVHGLQQEGRFAEARAILNRLPDAGSAEMRRQIQQAQADLELVERLDAIRMDSAAAMTPDFDRAQANREYEEVFQQAGLGTVDEEPALVARRIAASGVHRAIVAALDDWAFRATDKGRLSWILATARHADPDPNWRDQVRNPALWFDPPALIELADRTAFEQESVSFLLMLSGVLEHAGGDVISFLRRVQAAHPDDFWANFVLAEMLDATGNADAIGYYRAALALRPRAIAAYVNLGTTLSKFDRAPEAMEYWRQALRINPDAPMAHLNLAIASLNAGNWQEAIFHGEQTLRLDANSAHGHAVLGRALMRQKRFSEALPALQRALDLVPPDDPTRDDTAEALHNCELRVTSQAD